MKIGDDSTKSTYNQNITTSRRKHKHLLLCALTLMAGANTRICSLNQPPTPQFSDLRKPEGILSPVFGNCTAEDNDLIKRLLSRLGQKVGPIFDLIEPNEHFSKGDIHSVREKITSYLDAPSFDAAEFECDIAQICDGTVAGYANIFSRTIGLCFDELKKAGDLFESKVEGVLLHEISHIAESPIAKGHNDDAVSLSFIRGKKNPDLPYALSLANDLYDKKEKEKEVENNFKQAIAEEAHRSELRKEMDRWMLND